MSEKEQLTMLNYQEKEGWVKLLDIACGLEIRNRSDYIREAVHTAIQNTMKRQEVISQQRLEESERLLEMVVKADIEATAARIERRKKQGKK